MEEQDKIHGTLANNEAGLLCFFDINGRSWIISRLRHADTAETQGTIAGEDVIQCGKDIFYVLMQKTA